MKKKYFLILLITLSLSAVSYSQSPIITAIIDGDCSGGTPKVLEIYADGTVDFTLYSLENQTNANTAWDNTQSLAALGTVTDGFVYVVKDADLTIFNADFPSLTSAKILVTNTINVNGNDRLRIVKDSDSSVVDQYGISSEDGSGKDWEYKDGFGKRKDGTAANGGTFNSANWTNGNGDFNGKGTCQGGSTFESIIGVGSYTPPTAGVGEKTIQGFASYPNPVNNGLLTIRSSNSNEKNITIYNVLGKRVFQQKFSGATKQLDVSQISSGIYIMKVLEGDKVATKKLVIK